MSVGGRRFIQRETSSIRGRTVSRWRAVQGGGGSLLLEVEERGEDSSNTLVCDDISKVPQVAAQVIRKGPAHSERWRARGMATSRRQGDMYGSVREGSGAVVAETRRGYEYEQVRSGRGEGKGGSMPYSRSYGGEPHPGGSSAEERDGLLQESLDGRVGGGHCR